MHIAIATVGTTGDVAPFASLASGMLRAGHSVTAISWELHRAAFEAAGATFVAAGPATSWEAVRLTAERAASARNPLEQLAVLRDFHLREGADHYRTLLERLPGHDLVLLHGIHGLAEAAARDLRLRWATAVFDPVLLPTRDRPPAGMPGMGPFNGVAWWLLDRMLSRTGRPLGELLGAAGSASARTVRLFRGRSRLLHLVACSPALVAPPSDVPPWVAFTGPWLPRSEPARLPDAVEHFVQGGSPPALVTFGSMAVPDARALGANIVAGLRQAGLRGIVQAGAAGLEAAPGDDLLAIGAVDHRSLLPRCAVVIHHGGAGTSHAAALAGTPSVVLPHVGDQRFWGQRLHRLGAASAPLAPARTRPEALAERLRRATSAETVAASRRLAEQMRAEPDGVATAVGRLEEIAGRTG